MTKTKSLAIIKVFLIILNRYNHLGMPWTEAGLYEYTDEIESTEKTKPAQENINPSKEDETLASILEAVSSNSEDVIGPNWFEMIAKPETKTGENKEEQTEKINPDSFFNF